MSRLCFAVKAILAQYSKLHEIFDEIDTGVSGEIAIKMGRLRKEMSQTMQQMYHYPFGAAKAMHTLRFQ
jgi:DNA repair protein RecN (Recombination protein N)